MTALVRTDGQTCEVTPAQVEALEPLPAAYLPVGVPAGTWVRLTNEPPIPVQGTVAAVAALLAVASSSPLGGTAFIFRPGSPDAPAVGVFGTWAGLVTATAALAAAGAPFTVTVDLTQLGASAPITAPTNFGGQCTLRGFPSVFALQCSATNTLAGVVAVEDLTIEATGALAAGALVMPVGVSMLTLRGVARLISQNAAGPVIALAAGDTLLVTMLEGATLDTGASSAISLDPVGASLTVLVGKGSSIVNGAVSSTLGGTCVLNKADMSGRLPTALAAFLNYNGGGVTNTGVTLGAIEVVVHGGQYGAAALPLIFGAYFLPFGGNAGVALAAVVDSPLIEPQNGGRPRLLTGALISADVDGTDGVNPSTVEVLLNGVLIPGMTATSATLMNLNTTPVQLTPTMGAVRLTPLDVVSVRFTHGAAGIVATPTNPRALLLVG